MKNKILFLILMFLLCGCIDPYKEEITIYCKGYYNTDAKNISISKRTYIVYKSKNIVISKIRDSHYPNKNCFIENKYNWYCYNLKENQIYVSYGIASGKMMKEIEDARNGDLYIVENISYWEYLLYELKVLT